MQQPVRHYHRLHATSHQPRRLCRQAQALIPRGRLPQTGTVSKTTRQLRGAHRQHVLLHARLQHARVSQHEQIHTTNAAARGAIQQAQPHTYPRVHLSLPPAEQRPRPHGHGVRYARSCVKKKDTLIFPVFSSFNKTTTTTTRVTFCFLESSSFYYVGVKGNKKRNDEFKFRRTREPRAS